MRVNCQSILNSLFILSLSLLLHCQSILSLKPFLSLFELGKHYSFLIWSCKDQKEIHCISPLFFWLKWMLYPILRSILEVVIRKSITCPYLFLIEQGKAANWFTLSLNCKQIQGCSLRSRTILVCELFLNSKQGNLLSLLFLLPLILDYLTYTYFLFLLFLLNESWLLHLWILSLSK